MMTMIMVMTNKHDGDRADEEVLNDLLVIRICRKLISLSCFFESAMNDWGGARCRHLVWPDRLFLFMYRAQECRPP